MRVLAFVLAFTFGLALGADASGAPSWRDSFGPPVPTALTVDARCSAPPCDGIVDMRAEPGTPGPQGGQALIWRESVKTPLTSADLLRGACVVDDGPRPSGFARALPACKRAPSTTSSNSSSPKKPAG